MIVWLQERLTPRAQRIVIESMAILWIILAFALAGAFWKVVDLSNQTNSLVKKQEALLHDNQTLSKRSVALGRQNVERIREIQTARKESCEETYRSFHVILDPFIPPKANRSELEQARVDKFDAIIAKKIEHCGEQTGVKG